MQRRQCEVIGCLEAAVWARPEETNSSLEDFLCNDCWLRLRLKHPKQAASYVLCNAELVSPLARPSSNHLHSTAGESVVIA
ncbi:MAG: hypothetical protein JWL77_745 [Chthonomonadaceae bacterium]|nr:hypothetical protein [Chthonomonadaceae bacterium]